MTHTPFTPSSIAPPVFSGSNTLAIDKRCGKIAPEASRVASSIETTPATVRAF
jgi:hypothetical protein